MELYKAALTVIGTVILLYSFYLRYKANKLRKTRQNPTYEKRTKKIVTGKLIPTNIQVAHIQITYANGQKVLTKVYGHTYYSIDYGRDQDYLFGVYEPTAYLVESKAIDVARQFIHNLPTDKIIDDPKNTHLVTYVSSFGALVSAEIISVEDYYKDVQEFLVVDKEKDEL